MLSENIILQSAGSLSVAVMALLMLILQTLFFFRKPQFTWYAWSAAISFSALLYSVGIFLEYNTPEGPLNRFSGLLEYTAIICLVHCLYGFTFSYLGIESKRYHPVAGVCHGLILILLWSTNYIVADSFTTRDFIGLDSPYIEPALGPLGPVFVLYAALAGVIAMIVWIKHKGTDSKHRITFVAGMGFWLLLGIHDGLASLGLPTLQYFMEYGFLGFAMVVLWVVFNNYLEIAAEEKYRVITEFANDCILVIQNGKMVFRNPACCYLMGGPLTDSATRDFLDIMAPEDRKTVLKDYNTLLEGGHAPNPHTARIRGADGEQRFVEIASSLIQYRNRPAVLAIMRDMTKRKRAEEALRGSEERFRLLSEASFEGIVIHDKGEILDANQSLAKIFGYELDEIIGMNVLELAAPECRDVVKNNVLSGFEEAYEAIGVRKDGSTFPGELRGRQIEYKGNKVRITAARDLSGQKKAEEALRESEEKYKTILESIEDGYYEVDIAGNFMFFNDSLCQIFGYTKDELLDMNYRKNTDKEAADRLYQVFNSVYRTGKPSKGSEYKIFGKDDSTRYVEISASLLRDAEGKNVGFRGITRDVTERKIAEQEKARLETQFQQAQKMEATGTLAGGIAHDFNNLLMAIQGNASLMLLKKDPGHRDYPRLKNIEQYVQSGAELTKQLLGFARGGKYEVKPTDLNELIKKNSEMFGRTKKEIQIHLKYQEGLWTVEVDRGQIEQTLMNLYINAWQAMPGGGNLFIETENVELDRKSVMAYGVDPGKYVKISITDTGVGMDKKTLERIFDPFFTTKEMGKRSGLGLASAYGIIKNHGGIIDVRSKKGEETTFMIYLPASEKEVPREEELPEEVLEGEETILLVDDEEMIIDAGKEMLEEMGYTVLAAENGMEAIDTYREKDDEIDMVILDMIMPEMGGGETYDRLREADAEIKVLLSSGYSIDGEATEILERGCNGFIQKPFDMKEISRKIREVLDS